MNDMEFRLLVESDAEVDTTALDQMTPPTLDEWTAAIETVKTRETGWTWFERRMVTLRAPDGSTHEFPAMQVSRVIAAAQAKGDQLQVVN